MGVFTTARYYKIKEVDEKKGFLLVELCRALFGAILYRFRTAQE